MNYANDARPDRTRLLADSSMTVGNCECKMQVHVLARVCTYRRINGPCTCTKPTPSSHQL